MTDKQKFPFADAMAVAMQIIKRLAPACERIEIAGSLRRKKEEVGDIEVLYISRFVESPDRGDLFGNPVRQVNFDLELELLLNCGKLEKRKNELGQFTWGPYNKLARAVKAGIPVDFFAATHHNWSNLLVCRTGGVESNIRICQAALKIGWHWKPYTAGFVSEKNSLGDRYLHRCASEEEVFRFVNLPFLPPEERS